MKKTKTTNKCSTSEVGSEVKKRKGNPPVRVDRKFATSEQRSILTQHGYWDAAKRNWTEKGASLQTPDGIRTADLPTELASALLAAKGEKTAAKKCSPRGSKGSMETRLEQRKVFRLTDAERSQIIGKMIVSLEKKIGTEDKSVTAEMVKLLQLERDLAPPAEVQKPKRVAVMFVPPKDMNKYVLRKGVPAPAA